MGTGGYRQGTLLRLSETSGVLGLPLGSATDQLGDLRRTCSPWGFKFFFLEDFLLDLPPGHPRQLPSLDHF